MQGNRTGPDAASGLYRPAGENRGAQHGGGRTDICGSQARRGLRVGALRTLSRYLWPPGALEMKLRVVAALSLLAGAKLANVYVPILFKHASTLLAGQAARRSPCRSALLFAYGIAACRQHRVRRAARRGLRQGRPARDPHSRRCETFRHLHALALRFHLDRQTGGLSAAPSSAAPRASSSCSASCCSTSCRPCSRSLLVCGILWALFESGIALVTFVTVGGYIAYTLVVTEWRIKYRREMNETDSEANTRAIDSLLNYETVKYFGNEAHEARRFDSALARYEQRRGQDEEHACRLLNIGQGAIIAVGLTVVMVMAGLGVVARHDDGRRLRPGQRLPDPALPAAQLPRLRLPRDQAVADRHGADVRPARRRAPRSRTSRARRRWPSAAARSRSTTSTSPTTRGGRS